MPPSQAEEAIRHSRVDPLPTPPLAAPGGSWSHATSRLDRIVIVLTIGLALVTLWFASAPVLSTGRYYLLAVLWPLTAIAWAVALVGSVQRSASVVTGAALLVGASVTFGGSVPFVLMVLHGPGVAVAALAAGIGLLALILVLERRRRIAWLVAPVIVLATLALEASGLPRAARFAFAEPALTTHAIDLLGQAGAPDRVSGRVNVGGIGVGRPRLRDGCAVFVTAHVGVLGDSPAGIAYCPTGPTSNPTHYEQFSGHWYRW